MMSSTDAEWVSERDAHQSESQKHAPRAQGRRLRRVVYEYDEDSCDELPLPRTRDDTPFAPVRVDGQEPPIFAGQEMDGTYFLPIRGCAADEKELVSNRSQLTSRSQLMNRSQLVCAEAHCSECCEKKAPPAPRGPRTATATPLYLCAFGITTVLYSVSTAGIAPHNMATLGLVMFYGGLTQFVCGFFELINMNALGGTTAATYGAFWMGHAYMFNVGIESNTDLTRNANSNFMGGFDLVWFFFTIALFFCHFTPGSPLTIKALLFLLALDFLLQSIGEFSGTKAVVHAGGYVGLVVGSLAIYIAMALLMVDVYGRTILPLVQTKGWRIVSI